MAHRAGLSAGRKAAASGDPSVPALPAARSSVRLFASRLRVRQSLSAPGQEPGCMPSRPGARALRQDGRVAECVFCEILSGERKAHVVLEDPIAIAFLDARPVFKGHVLLVPRAHVPTFADLAEECIGPVFSLAKRLAVAMEAGLGAAGSVVAMNNLVSQSEPHQHVRVMTRDRQDGLRGVFWTRTKYESDHDV